MNAIMRAARCRALERNFLRFGARRVQARLHAARANGHLEGFDGFRPAWLSDYFR
ncbi:MAG: hypothetical protein AB1593_02210 [Pseudomonadota bacterium]